MRNKRDIFDSLAVMRDDYKSKYDAIQANYDKRIKEIEQNFKPSAPLFAQEKQNAKNEFETNIEQIRNEAKTFIDGELEQIKSLIDAEITILPTNENVINNLQRLYDLPLSRCEVEALAKRYDKSNYWVSKIVHDLAEKNGVNLPSKQASAQVMYDILDNLSDRVDTFLADWKGEKESEYTARASLADSQLIKLERRFTNDFKDSEVSSHKNVQIALANVSEQREVFKQAMYLQTLYNNVDAEQKKYLFYELANNTRIYQDSLRSADIDYLVEDFKNSKEFTKIDNAVKAADSLRLMKEPTQEDIENTIASHGGYSTYMKAELANLYGSHNDNANKALEVAEIAQNESN